MKVRKTLVNENETKIFLYENKKEEYILVAIPAFHWSFSFTYEKFGKTLIVEMTTSLLKCTGLSEGKCEALALRLDQWTKEM
ncbi:YueH family protein [Bacillus sp. 2205SS5-2]|uniref:YueH family protein n=1 Tax=Bacillus sp. 2205SS5-2 TaxID=3109031 RepID=UPI0030043FE6